jgi:predicted metal-dependent enzyme (double-stranded beta helix superfamily)
MKLKQTVGDPNEEVMVKAGYEDFFAELMDLVRNRELNEQLGEDLKRLALDFPNRYDLKAFNTVSGRDYERTFIGKDASGWEAIMMTWRKGKHSAIHSHPQFAAYNVLQGKVMVEVFADKGDGEIELLDRLEVGDNTGLFAIGDSPSMTNHIHRISGLSDVSYSLHIYSDDARKGFTYSL